MSKGIIELIRERGVGVHYDKLNRTSIVDMFEQAIKLDAELKKRNRKQGYILSKSEAETLPLDWLTWLGNNYTVLVSLEVSNIIKERFKK